MCDPVTIAGLALTVGSTAVNTVAQKKAANALTLILKSFTCGMLNLE